MTHPHPLDLGFHVPDSNESASAQEMLELIDSTCLGPAAAGALRQALGIIAAGHAVRMAPQTQFFTLEDAAAFLGVPVADVVAADAATTEDLTLDDVLAIRDQHQASAPVPEAAIGEYPDSEGAPIAYVGDWELDVPSASEVILTYYGDPTLHDAVIDLALDGVPQPTIRVDQIRSHAAVTVVTAAFEQAEHRVVMHLARKRVQGIRAYAAAVIVSATLTVQWTDADGARHRTAGNAELWLAPGERLVEVNAEPLNSGFKVPVGPGTAPRKSRQGPTA